MKIYQNDRLKPVLFHGKQVNPLYIQLTFDRQPIYFKSYYFDLLSKPQYVARHYTGNVYPAIQQVQEKEERLINFIIDEYANDFSLELFKEKYTYYSRDLLTMMEQGFKEYLYFFFNDEGDNMLASMIELIGMYESAYFIVDGLKRPLKPALYDKMIKNAAYYAPPYLPLVEMARKKGEGWLTTLSIYEWQKLQSEKVFSEMLTTTFPEYDERQLRKTVEKLING